MKPLLNSLYAAFLAAAIGAGMLYALTSPVDGQNLLVGESAVANDSGSATTTATASMMQNATTVAETVQESDALSLTALFEQLQQSVVQVSSTMEGPDGFSQLGLGSGFVYDSAGHVITNNHVVAGSSDEIHVTFSDGTIYRAEVVGTDPYSDIAVLRVQDVPGDKLAPVIMGNSTELQVGQDVVAIGNPFGLSGSMTEGIVSGLGRLIPAYVNPLAAQAPTFSIPDVIQTDAAINPGNSGGPLLTLDGRVIGMNTAIFSTTGGFAGVGFAVPSNAISKIVPVLIEQGFYQHPWLGISGTDMTPDIAEAIGLEEPRGFLVIDTVQGSPADRAGLQGGENMTTVGARELMLGGDVIVGIDGNSVRKIDDILSYLEKTKEIGDEVTLTVWRNVETRTVDLTLAPRPGLEVSP